MLADAQRNRYVHQQMNHSQTTNSAQACGAQVASEAPTQPQHQQIKLAMDVHAASIVVGRMIDGAKAQPPQTFKPADFLQGCTQSSLLPQRQHPLSLRTRFWWLLLVAAVRDLAPCLSIPIAQLTRHVESLSARSGSANSEHPTRVFLAEIQPCRGATPGGRGR